jgi:hypothetical protein
MHHGHGHAAWTRTWGNGRLNRGHATLTCSMVITSVREFT